MISVRLLDVFRSGGWRKPLGLAMRSRGSRRLPDPSGAQGPSEQRAAQRSAAPKHRAGAEAPNRLSRLGGVAATALLLTALLAGCAGEPHYTPKPRAYPRVEYPKRHYVPFEAMQCCCDFTFEYPDYMVAQRDSTFFDTLPPHPCWFNLDMPVFNGSLYFTYTPFKGAAGLYKAMRDAHRLASEHDKRATFSNDYLFRNEYGTTGIIYEIEGNVASAFQFVLTDSVQHSVRGSLYFRTQPDEDSLRPIVAFVRQDVMHLLNTFRWQPRRSR